MQPKQIRYEKLSKRTLCVCIRIHTHTAKQPPFFFPLSYDETPGWMEYMQYTFSFSNKKNRGERNGGDKQNEKEKKEKIQRRHILFFVRERENSM
mmetsp:Transcript_7022/g.9411  ORF Transcript_7022/g.9411 Transcript_7022/m.9411 type:complete len:95 (+) Transcript_7022:137-421(+)